MTRARGNPSGLILNVEEPDSHDEDHKSAPPAGRPRLTRAGNNGLLSGLVIQGEPDL